jgi:uncharacterized protein (TIGR02145 family)/uncharacterized repeat protein (TIGR02543 family)
MDASKTLVAMFTPIVYTLTVNANPRSGGTVFIDGTALAGAAPQDAGTQVVALAQAADGYVFTGWEGVATGTTNPITVNITSSNQTLIANFQQQEGPLPQTYTLSVNANPSAGGTVTPTSRSNMAAGTPVSISAVTNGGYDFVNWTVVSGTVTFGNASSANTTVTLSTSATIRANFTQGSTVTYTITYDINGGSGTPPAAQNVNAGGSVTLANGSGFAHDEFVFGGWNTNSSSTGTNYSAGSSFTPTGNITLFARWNSSEGGNCSYTGPTVRIGNLTWMAENLNCETSNSWCYDNNPANCAIYGRLYTWDAAMIACPAGWRLPTRADWDDLVSAAGGSSVAGRNLKSQTGWSGGGTDAHGFSALPGGRRWDAGYFSSVGWNGYWWSAAELDASYAWFLDMNLDYDGVSENFGSKSNGLSVRCSRD